MPHELLSVADLDFLVFDWLRAGELTTREPFSEHTEESFRAAMDASKRIADRFYAPHFAANDRNEPYLQNERVTLILDVRRALDEFAKAGLIAAPLDPEGTHGIQALDFLGRKLVMRDGAGLRALSDAIERTVDRASATELRCYADALSEARDRMTATVSAVWQGNQRDRGLANASVFLEASGHVIISWLWLDQAMSLDRSADDDFVRGKLAACRYFFRYELPKVFASFDLVASGESLFSGLDPSWL